MRVMRLAFESQFEPHDDGYVYYPTVWGGGRFVSAAEYDLLRRKNERFTRFVYSWRGLILWVIASLLFGFASVALDPSRTYHYLTFTAFLWVMIFGVMGGPNLVARRLVRGRAIVKAPRDRRARQEAQREVRAASRGLFLTAALVSVALALSYLLVG